MTSVTAERVQVEADSGELDEYQLLKFVRTNQGTCINQRPIVTVGQRVDVRSAHRRLARPPRAASWRSARTSSWRS